MDRGAWQATVHGVAKESDTTEWLNNNNSTRSFLFCSAVLSTMPGMWWMLKKLLNEWMNDEWVSNQRVGRLGRKKRTTNSHFLFSVHDPWLRQKIDGQEVLGNSILGWPWGLPLPDGSNSCQSWKGDLGPWMVSPQQHTEIQGNQTSNSSAQVWTVLLRTLHQLTHTHPVVGGSCDLEWGRPLPPTPWKPSKSEQPDQLAYPHVLCCLY